MKTNAWPVLVSVLVLVLTGCQSQTYNVDVAVNANGQSAAAPLSAGCDPGGGKGSAPNLSATTERSQSQVITVNLSLPGTIAKPIEVSPARQIEPVVRDAALAVTGARQRSGR